MVPLYHEAKEGLKAKISIYIHSRLKRYQKVSTVHTLKIATLCLTGLFALALALLVLPQAQGADTFEYEIDPDDVDRKRTDESTEISFDTLITNNKNEKRQFQLEIVNATELKNRQHIIATFDDNNDEAASIRSPNVNEDGGQANMPVYVKAPWNAIRGLHLVTIKASDVDFEEEHFLNLQVVINENFSVELVNLDQDKEGSADLQEKGGEYTYRLRIRNTGNSADKFKVEVTDSGWDTELDFDRKRVRAYKDHEFNITVTPDKGLDYGDEDELTVRVTSNRNSDNGTTETYTTIIRVKWGLEVTVPQIEKQTKPGESVNFDLDIFNKWTEEVNIQITIQSKPTSSWSANPTGYSGSDDLAPHRSFTRAKVQVTPPASQPPAKNKVVKIKVHVLQAPDNDLDVSVSLIIEVIVEYKFHLELETDNYQIPITTKEQLAPPLYIVNEAAAEDTFTIIHEVVTDGNEPDSWEEWDIEISESDFFQVYEFDSAPLFISVKVPETAEENDKLFFTVTATSLGSGTKRLQESVLLSVVADKAPEGSGTVHDNIETEDEFPIPREALVGLVVVMGLLMTVPMIQKTMKESKAKAAAAPDFTKEWGAAGASLAPTGLPGSTPGLPSPGAAAGAPMPPTGPMPPGAPGQAPAGIPQPVTVKCPTCTTMLKVADPTRPLTIQCPSCQTQLSLTEPPPEAPAGAPAAPTPPPAPAPTPPPQASEPVTIQCPSCATQMSVADPTRPLTIQCPTCQTQLSLTEPPPGAPAGAPAAPTPPPAPAPAAPPPTSGPVTIQCPSCATQMSVADPTRPLTIQCPTCQTQLQLN